jgi:ribosomal protein S18 acetylase RimI-like enzyme
VPSDATLVRASARNHRSWMAATARASGGRVWTERGLPCALQRKDRGELLIPFPGRYPPEALDTALAWADRHAVGITGCWSTGLQPDRLLTQRLLERGFETGWQPHWMATGLRERDAPADPRVSLVTEVPEFDAYGSALLALTRRRPARFWLAVARLPEGRLAGFAWSHVAAGIAGVYDVVVFPHASRQGLGRALTAAVLTAARQAGARHAVLNATAEGELLYRALGFRSLGWGRTWWRHASA